MTVKELNRDQLDELKEAYFWGEETADIPKFNHLGLPALFAGDIPDNVIFEYFAGIHFVNDDFFCTAGGLVEFQAVFQIDRLTLFEVHYYTLSTNKNPYFSTGANHFIRSKRDYDRAGQAQNALLPRHSPAFTFFKKWDPHHLHELSPRQHEELLTDLETLKTHYNYIYEEFDTSRRPYSPHFAFSRLVEFSKQKPK